MDNDELILKEFNISNIDEIVSVKTTGKQKRFQAISQVPTVVEMSADECKKLCEKAGIQYETGYERRVLSGVTTNEDPDRYGDIVRYKGIQFDNYYKNPLVLLSHMHCDFPIGKSIKIWKEPGSKCVKSWDLYVDERVDQSLRSSMAFKFRQSGMMPGISIGFLCLEAKTDHTPDAKAKMGLGKYGIEFLSVDYLEHSQVSVPANPSALTNFLKSIDKKSVSGIFCKDDILILERIKFFEDVNLINIIDDFAVKTHNPTVIDFGLTRNGLDISDILEKIHDQESEIDTVYRPYPNEHACRLNDSDKYDDFRRGKRTHNKKTYSVIFGHIKDTDTWEEQAYRYNKEKWDTEDARSHCKSHGGIFEPAKGEKIVLNCGTVLVSEDGKTWKSIPKEKCINDVLVDKMNDISIQIKSMCEKIVSSDAGGSTKDTDDDSLYCDDILEKITM